LIYICIPTHNEQQTVGVVLWKLRQVLTDYPRDYQLLVADDASTDKTQDVLEPYTRVLPLTVIRSDRQQGHAASLEMLLREAARRSEYPKRDVIVTLQADFSEEPDDLVTLLKRMEAGADVAVGTKVATRKQSAMRRFARKLGGFFARGGQWPEGMPHPFDGYRAYRLYAVKNAIDERGARRLLRYDGWACHAELLRAVLPHARRIEIVEVEDRSDRKQRPSREKPLAAAMQVRAMMRNAEPGGLASVEELDRLAATASRARERTAVGNGSALRARSGPRGNGQEGRNRGRGEERTRSEGRGRTEGRPRSEGRTRSEGGPREGGRARTESRTRSPSPAGRRPEGGRQQGDPQEGRREGQERPRRERQPRHRPESEAATLAAGAAEGAPPAEEQKLLLDAPGMEGAAAGMVEDSAAGEAGTEGAPRKRRRRRRGRGSSRSSAEAGVDGRDASSGEGDPGDEDGAGDGPEGEAGDGPDGEPRKRRRRGGRRGGRGRRRRSGPAEGEAGEGESGGEQSNESGPGAGDAPAPAVAAAPESRPSEQEQGLS
jgi:glycosyltransferase involved in cell wall biosynthesis